VIGGRVQLVAARTATVLPTADLAGDDASNDSAMQERMRAGFLMRSTVEQILGRDALRKRQPGEAEVGGPGCTSRTRRLIEQAALYDRRAYTV
jgi:hypothetical protein